MKKFGKILTAVAAAVLAVAMGVMFAACGGTKSSSYTATTDNIEAWDYTCVSINAFGDEAGVGMINLNSWGAKKLQLGSDGTCAGVGCSWTIKLDVEGDAYTLSFIAHLVGAGSDYTGEGDLAYIFEGTCTSVDGGYKLAAPTYAKATLDGSLTLAGDETDFANYIPTAPAVIDSNGDNTGNWEGFKGKIASDKLLTTIFLGATFKVSGESITEVTDIIWS